MQLFRNGLRRWGFHGLSYESIARASGNSIPHSLPGGSSRRTWGAAPACARCSDSRSIDTTMSFSVLDGLAMGTRCGSLDPGAILFLLRDGWTCDQIEDLLYKKSGLLGISGVSNDVRDLLASEDPRAAEAIDYFVYRIVREIGSLTAALGGLDALIFTAGVGENSAVIRQRVCAGLEWLNYASMRMPTAGMLRCISPSEEAPPSG